MKISSKFVGCSLKEYRTVVNWRDTMNYAVAVKDNNLSYFNDEQEPFIVAPPMYSVASREEMLPQIPSSSKVEVPVWQQTIMIDPLRPYIYAGTRVTEEELFEICNVRLIKWF